MPTVVPINDRTAGCMSNFLFEHHKATIEIKVAVARMQWSAYNHKNNLSLSDLMLEMSKQL